jgi:nucleotide-binding universal stress UspA family protein
MSTTERTTPEMVDAYSPTLLPDGPILVASNTTPESDTAFPLASALSDRAHADVEVISVVEPVNIPMYGVDGMVVSIESADDMTTVRTNAARAQVIRTVSTKSVWPISVVVGDPAREITAHADSTHARLIIVGRGRHHGLERVLGGELVLRLLQRGDSPVLAVEDGLTSPPRRVVIATDFSPFSLYAAHVAMTIAAPDAVITLLHIGPPFDETVPFLHERAIAYRESADRGFARMRAALGSSKATIDQAVLTGNASDELVIFVRESHADLVVTATHGYGFIRRAIIGSVTASLVRNAPCSVLAVPGSARTIAESRAMGAPNARTRRLIATALDSELSTFSTRNAGRRCDVEVDQADLGAQTLGHDLTLVGASFDKHKRTVSVMFGMSAQPGMHMTHSVDGVSAIDLSSNAGGVDQVLRLVHDDGQTLVTFR